MRKQGARVSPRPVRAGGEGPVLAATPGSDHGRQTDGDSFTESFMRKRAPKPRGSISSIFGGGGGRRSSTTHDDDVLFEANVGSTNIARSALGRAAKLNDESYLTESYSREELKWVVLPTSRGRLIWDFFTPRRSSPAWYFDLVLCTVQYRRRPVPS